MEKIFADKKINSEVFFEKKEIVEARYEQELEEIEELRKESERLHNENNTLYGQFKEGDRERHELALKGRNLEN